jgi:hypothetical protein
MFSDWFDCFDRYYGEGGGDYTDAWGNPRYGNMAPVSRAALRREKEAKEAFCKVKKEIEEREDPPTGKTIIPLLQPHCHLTCHTWGTFRKFVVGHAGWNVKRRVATPEEKKKSGEKRKGKVYFVDVIYTAPTKEETPPASAAACVSGNKRVAPVGVVTHAASAAKDTKSSYFSKQGGVEDDSKMAAPVAKKAKLSDATNAH